MQREPEKSPRTAEEQEQPEPERLVTPEEEAGMDLQSLDHPPQAEGGRGEYPDGVKDEGRREEGGGRS
jgi:hypothetical protein